MLRLERGTNTGLKFRNIDDIYHYHNELIGTINSRDVKNEPDIKFPAPPIPPYSSDEEDVYIVPVTSYRELAELAMEHSNCLRAYSGRIQSNKAYIYRFKSPFESTEGSLEIYNRVEYGQRPVWELSEVALKFNKRVSNRLTIQFIREWLESNRVKNSEIT